MASAWYPKGKQALMNKQIDVDTDTIKVRAVSDAGYTYSTAHDFMDDVTAYVGSTDATLASVDITTTPGSVDAADLSPAFSSLAQNATDTIDGLVIYYFNTNDTSSIPLIYIDLAASTTPNGGDINITWDTVIGAL